MSHSFVENKEALFEDVSKKSQAYHQNQPGVIVSADNMARYTAYIDASELEADQNFGIKETSAYFKLPTCPISGEQLLTVSGEWQADTYDGRVEKDDAHKLKKQFNFIRVDYKLAGTKIKGWEFYNVWELSCFPCTSTNVSSSTGYTPRKKSAEESLADELREKLGLDDSG